MGNLSDWEYHLCEPNPCTEVCAYANTMAQSVFVERQGIIVR
ncbi:MAG TPA: hypothetical protein ACFYEL_07010 [Candidatus Wunengus californicus]